MPKPFSQKQKLAIKQKLLKIGLKRFSRQGIRAVRIDDLCRDAGIAKGSFYTFFSSKEELFVAISESANHKHRKEIRLYLKNNSSKGSARASGFFDMLIDKISEDPLLQLLIEHGEVEYLVRHIPPHRMQQFERDNHIFIEEITRAFSSNTRDTSPDTPTIEGLFILAKSLVMQKHLMAQSSMEKATEILRQSFIVQLTRSEIQ